MVYLADGAAAVVTIILVERNDLGCLFLATARCRRVIPVHRADVISVGAILQLELPVAVVNVRRIAAQNFETFGCLVDHLVDDHAGRAQPVVERQDVRVDAAEEKSAVISKRATLARSCDPSVLNVFG